MIRLFVSTAVLGLTCASAIAAPPSWQGTFFVTQASSGCAASDNTVGEFGTILYRPIINGGDPAEGISLFFSRSTETIVSGSGPFRGSVTYAGFETGHSVYPNQFKGTSNLKITPGAISSSTGEVTITGTINNFFNNNPTCNVVIIATLLPRL